jgi:hypothetical protein
LVQAREGKSSQGKRFFFAKKNQKTLFCWRLSGCFVRNEAIAVLRRISMGWIGADENGSDQSEKSLLSLVHTDGLAKPQPNEDFLLLFCKKEGLAFSADGHG